MKRITDLPKDKLLHFVVMGIFSLLAFIVFFSFGFACPHLKTGLAALILAVGWEIYHKVRGGTNTLREMALDTFASMAGASLVVIPVYLVGV